MLLSIFSFYCIGLIYTIDLPDSLINFPSSNLSGKQLAAMLKNPIPTVRYGAASTILYFNKKDAINPLFALLEDESDDVKLMSADILSELYVFQGDEPLLNQIPSSSGIKKQVLIRLLQAHPPKSVLPMLISELSDTTTAIKEGIITALGNSGDERALFPLLFTLMDNSKQIRADAAKALSRLNSKAIPYLRVISLIDDEDLLEAITSNMIDIDAEEIPDLIAPLLYSSNASVRRLAIRYLSTIKSSKSIDYLYFASLDGSPQNREIVVERLLLEDNLKYRPQVYSNALRDSSSNVRLAGLTYMDDNDAIYDRSLLVRLVFDKEAVVRSRAAIRLARARLKVYNEFIKVFEEHPSEWDGFFLYLSLRKVPETNDLVTYLLRQGSFTAINNKLRQILSSWNANLTKEPNDSDVQEDTDTDSIKTTKAVNTKKDIPRQKNKRPVIQRTRRR